MAENFIPDSRELFHATCAGVKFYRPPFWLMRQAGRYLPEYRQLKEKYGFLGIVKTPEVAVEAALQPMRRFDFDCAIIFSDILVVSEALGFPYKFKDVGGIMLERKVCSERDIKEVCNNVKAIRERLSYVADNARLLRKELPKKAVLGFCPAPLTLACYMLEGEGSTTFPALQSFAKESPILFGELMDSLAEALAEYLKMQIECGLDGVQIFDSHASITPEGKFDEMSGQWVRGIIQALDGRTRTIFFAPKMSHRFDEISTLGADIYSVDDSRTLSELRTRGTPPYGLQGNLNPDMLSNATPEEVSKKTHDIIADMSMFGRHIFNLGHGIKPDAKIENVEALCSAVKDFK